MNKRIEAIVLAAGIGSRMKSDIPKQFININGLPVLYYTLKAFEESKVDSIVLVAGKDMIEYVNDEILNKYEFKKIKCITEGGAARYLSVINGLKKTSAEFVLIHDGARPLIRTAMINEIIDKVIEKEAVIPGVAVKDTVKIIDSEGKVQSTPNRDALVTIQTPQAFNAAKLKNAYSKIDMSSVDSSITDDACVWERYCSQPVYVIEGDNNNIKITTPEDLIVAEMIIENRLN